jgi:hypothetical protein
MVARARKMTARGGGHRRRARWRRRGHGVERAVKGHAKGHAARVGGGEKDGGEKEAAKGNVVHCLI